MITIILGGFLGSGKTTALMQMARYLTSREAPDNNGAMTGDATAAPSRESAYLVRARTLNGQYTPQSAPPRVIILENEIGEVGVDDKYLRSGGFSVTNLFSGCACCTVSGDLTAAAREIRDEVDPEFLIIETTGVAYPINIRENLARALGVESRIVILTDAARWKRLLVPLEALLAGQIVGSDAVLINKCDLKDDEALREIEADILRLEPDAKIFRVSALSEIPGGVWNAVTGV
ncbi:MAG: cobalamin biosynthesis protein P47K [Oscillospiraceae bacterium]|jgi:G3E family GTPase|nr:cobalamin biosynthesis protein P47K [Oscillospiraceae bacterium]